MVIRCLIISGFLIYLTSILLLESSGLTLLLHLFISNLISFVKIQGFDENNQQSDTGMLMLLLGMFVACFYVVVSLIMTVMVLAWVRLGQAHSLET